MIACRIAAIVLSLSLLAGAQPAAAFDQAVIGYCKSDIQRLCPDVQPGGGRILQCLKSHKQEMTVGCAQGLAKLKAGMGK